MTSLIKGSQAFNSIVWCHHGKSGPDNSAIKCSVEWMILGNTMRHSNSDLTLLNVGKLSSSKACLKARGVSKSIGNEDRQVSSTTFLVSRLILGSLRTRAQSTLFLKIKEKWSESA